MSAFPSNDKYNALYFDRKPPKKKAQDVGDEFAPGAEPAPATMTMPEDRPPPAPATGRGLFQPPSFARNAAPITAPPPSDGIDPGALQDHRQNLLRQIDDLVRQRVLLGSRGDRAGATAIRQQEDLLRSQLHRANRVMASQRPQMSDEQINAGRASLNAQLPAATGAVKDQLASDVDIAHKRVEDARNFFLTKPPGKTEADVFDEGPPSERRYLTPAQESLGAVNERAALRAAQQAERAQAGYNPPNEIDFGPITRGPGASDFDRTEVARTIGEGDSAREFAAKRTAAEREAELASVGAETAKARALTSGFDRTAVGQDVGSLEDRTKAIVARRGLAEAQGATSLDSLDKDIQVATASLDGLGVSDVAEVPARFGMARDRVQSLAAYAQNDPAGAAAIASKAISRLRATVAKNSPGLASYAMGPGYVAFYNALAGQAQQLISELEPISRGVAASIPASSPASP